MSLISESLIGTPGVSSFVICSVTMGQIIPANVPTPLLMPIKIEAYRGAMSRWLTLNPEMANPELPTAMMSATTAWVSV